jgi:hypothetical protein
LLLLQNAGGGFFRINGGVLQSAPSFNSFQDRGVLERVSALLSRTCTICRHTNRNVIDQALITRTPLREIAAEHNVSKSALMRHFADHVPADLIRARDAADASRADDLLTQVQTLQAKALTILEATQESDPRAALSAIREARECIRLLGELAGKLQAQASVHLILSPEWRAIQALMLTALEPHPEARIAVAHALAQLDPAVAGHA